jgi:putative DNA primase/helicase
VPPEVSDLQRVLGALRGVRRHRDQYLAVCPAHDDRRPSLAVRPTDSGRILLYCHAGCSVEAIAAAIGLPREVYGLPPPRGRGRILDMPREVAGYDYFTPAGELVYQVVRYSEPKDFRQRRPDGHGGWTWNLDGVEPIPYNLPAIYKRPEQPVFVVEGEKDVESLRPLGLLATCNSGGAGKWKHEYGTHFRGRRVAILPDHDWAGYQHGLQVAACLLAYASSIRTCYLPGLPDGGDVSDFLEMHCAGWTPKQKKDEIVKLVKASPEWRLLPGVAA